MKIPAILAALAAALLTACTPAPSPESKRGIAINNVSDIAYTVSEIGAVFEFPQASGTAAVAEEAIGVVGPGPQTIPIGSIIIHPTAGLAISGSSFITVNVYKRTAGGSQTLIGTLTTFTGGTALAAFTPASLTLQTGAGSFVSPNDTITMAVSNTSTAAQPAFTIAGFTKAL